MTLLTTLQSLLAPLAAGGAWPVVAPQGGPKPYIVYSRIGSGVLNIVNGPPPADNTHLQVDVYAATYAAASDVANAVVATLQAAATAGTFGCNLIISPRDLIDPDTRLYRVLMEFSFWTT